MSCKEPGVVVDFAWRGKCTRVFSGHTSGGAGGCSWPEGLTLVQMPQSTEIQKP